MPTTIPARLNIRLSADEQAAAALIAASVTIPHRRPPTITEAIRTALNIAAATLQADGAAKAS